jgi:hypothetical protein
MGGGIRIGKPTVTRSNDTNAARSEAQKIAKQLDAGSLSAKQSLLEDLEFFSGMALFEFVNEMDRYYKETARESESTPEQGVDADGGAIFSSDLAVVVPASRYRVVRGGTSYQFSAQIYDETSSATSVEVFTEVSGGVEASVGLEAKAGPVKFSIAAKGGVRRGEKWTNKDEQKQGTRKGETISRNFKAQKVARDVVVLDYRKTYYGSGPIARRWEIDERSMGTQEENGFLIVPGEGGDPYGPFWPDYTPLGQVIDSSSTEQARKVLDEQKRQLAEDLVNGTAP